MIWIHPVEGKILNILYCNMQIFKIALPQNVISQCMMIDKKVNKIILYSNNILYTLLALLYLLLVYCRYYLNRFWDENKVSLIKYIQEVHRKDFHPLQKLNFKKI